MLGPVLHVVDLFDMLRLASLETGHRVLLPAEVPAARSPALFVR